MNAADKRKMLVWNSVLWILAMLLPAFFSFALAGTKFPWQIVLPLLLVGPMLVSNKMLMQASGESADAPKG